MLMEGLAGGAHGRLMGRGRSELERWGWGLKGRSRVGAEGGHHADSLLEFYVFSFLL